MTAPNTAEFEFVAETPSQPGAIVGLEEPATPTEGSTEPFPPAILDLSEEKRDEIKRFLDEQIASLISSQQPNQDNWAELEKAYRARREGKKTLPFRGAAREVMPVIAMAVDPIHARLDTGIFKQKPVFTTVALKRNLVNLMPALMAWIDFYQKHFLKLRQIASPRMHEMSKLGTMVFKTVYHNEEVNVRSYNDKWEVQIVSQKRFAGPKVFGISIGDFLFPASYQHVQDCPIVAERQRTTLGRLRVAEASKLLTNVDKLSNQETVDRTPLEAEREDVGDHTTTLVKEDIVVYEVWFDFDADDDGIPEKMVATYHINTRTFLQLRYNWYFHQRYPYTVIPYSVTNDSLYGLGIAEMVLPFQEAITRFYQMAADNAYLANIRMFIAKKDSGIEDVPRLYAGRTFFVNDPTKDFIPFSAGDIYPSTLMERTNLFGMVEKRTGVSDYLTGRESPIVGTRATATGTLALIQEGTRRVEEVLENIRSGFGEVIENCIYIWIQYGLGNIDELVFGDDQISADLKTFFSSVTRENVSGAIAIDLTATDAAGNKQAMQQMQLQIIQVMMGYLEKVLAVGQAALEAEKQSPQLAEMMKEVMRAARQMFKELLGKYDIRNPEDYLPDLEQFLNGTNIGEPGVGGDAGGRTGGLGGEPGLPEGRSTLAGSNVPRPATPGAGVGGAIADAIARAGGG